MSQIARTERTLADAERDILLLSGQISVLQSELRSNREAVQLAREMMDSKLAATSTVLETRLSHLNALRDSYEIKSLEWEKRSNLFFTRESHELYQKIVDVDLRSLREWKSTQEGKASQAQVNWSLGFSFFSIIVALLVAIVQIMHGKP